MNSFDELLHHYGSDKANIFRKNNSLGHGFSKFYEQQLIHLKDKEINVLEIGSYAGASAAAIKKYFPNSKICCLDINISNFIYTSRDINVYGLDIKNKKNLENILKKINNDLKIDYFDIIIDDGSHYLGDILLGIKNLFKCLKQKGVYIIEDYKHPNYYDYNKNIDHILIDELLIHLEKKFFFKSNILTENDQSFLFKNIKKIKVFKGNLKDSDICFIEKI
ncbi:hypothetical protein OAS21_00465 [Pelagibacteraceae bacterium]|jgi:SAM-dependent methyltransferase|nr:hypothetical protein [Pelagibacteraceae bacterium]